MKSGLSIRYKFLLVTTLLLVFCVLTYLVMATQVFRKDKRELVFDLNRSVVNNLASDIDGVIQSATDKMRLAAYFFNSKDEKNLAILQQLLSASHEIVYVGGSEHFDKLGRRFFQKSEFLETYELSENFFDETISQQKPVPFEKIQTEGESIWNATIPNGPPLIGIGRSVVIEDSSGRPSAHYAVVAYLRVDRIVSALTKAQLSQALVTTEAGDVLIHGDASVMAMGKDLSIAELVEAAKNQNIKSSVLQFTHADRDYLGAFAKTGGQKLLVLSKVSAEQAFSVVDQFIKRSGLVALMVLNLSFIAAILFARTLTRPLQVLMDGMSKVAEGQLSTHIEVKSRDEISELAKSFNGMIHELSISRQALEESHRELEEKVKERTLQLEKQNQAVKSAQENLLKTTRLAAVGEIAGRAAHEVLNPLTTILARVERIQERLGGERMPEVEVLQSMTDNWREDFAKGGFDQLIKTWKTPSQIHQGQNLWEEDVENLEQVRQRLQAELKVILDDSRFLHKEAQRIAKIVQAMRGLSVVESEKKNYSMKKLLDEVANIMRDLASQHAIQISVISQSNEWFVVVDYDEFIQALTNLIRNSIYAIAQRSSQSGFKGLVELEVKESGENLELFVRDNGCGMQTDIQERLFESQITTKSRGEGTGLGLNISRRFVRAFGGDIVLEKSKMNEGTTFIVRLPKAQRSAA